MRNNMLQIISFLYLVIACGLYTCWSAPPEIFGNILSNNQTSNFVVVRNVTELENAVTNAIEEMTILIEDGTYKLTKPLIIQKNKIVLKGKNGDRSQVILKGEGMASDHPPHAIAIYSSDVIVADLTLGWVPYHGIQIHGEKGAMRPKLYNLHILDCGQQLIKVSSGSNELFSDSGELSHSRLEYSNRAPSGYTNGIDVLAGKNWRIHHNEFIRIRGPKGQCAGPAILIWQNSINSIVEKNLILDCDKGIAFGNPAGPNPKYSRYGEKKHDHQGGIVRNNMIVRLSDGDCGIEFNNAKNFLCVHNTVYLYSSSINWAIEYRFLNSNGIIKNNLTNMSIIARDGANAIVKNNITTAKQNWFIDVSSGNLHLTDQAIDAIDKAIPVQYIYDDFDGQKRPIGKAPDIGADEK